MTVEQRRAERVFAAKLAQHQQYLARASRRFTRPGRLDADDLEQECMIALWENLTRECTRPDHVADGLLTYSELPDADLDPLLMRAFRSRMLTLVRREEASIRDCRASASLDGAPEIVDETTDPERRLAAQQDLAHQAAMVEEMIGLAFEALDDEACVVAYELLHPRDPSEIPGATGRRIDPRSSYSIAAILDVSRDHARRLIGEVRAAFAVAAAQLGYERDLVPLVRS